MSDARKARIAGYLANLSPQTRANWRKALGLPRLREHPPAQANMARDAELVALWHSGATMTEIGDAIGMTRERVRQILKRNGIEGRQRTGWAREPLANNPRLANAMHVKRERMHDRQATTRRLRYRLTVWVLRDLAADLGRKPSTRELGQAMFWPTRPNPLPWVLGYVGAHERYAETTAALYADAGLGTPRGLGAPGHIGPRRPRTPKAHCKRGHPRAEWGGRRCGICHRDWARKRYQRNKEVAP